MAKYDYLRSKIVRPERVAELAALDFQRREATKHLDEVRPQWITGKARRTLDRLYENELRRIVSE